MAARRLGTAAIASRTARVAAADGRVRVGHAMCPAERDHCRKMQRDVAPVADVAGIQWRLGRAAGRRGRWGRRCRTSRVSPASRSRRCRTSSTTTRTSRPRTRERVLTAIARAGLSPQPLGARPALGQDRGHRAGGAGAAGELLRRTRRCGDPSRRAGGLGRRHRADRRGAGERARASSPALDCS